jgi:hypothetical protein
VKLVEFKAKDVFDMIPGAMARLENHKPDKTALCVDAAACMARIQAKEATKAKAAEERRREMERLRRQRELDGSRQAGSRGAQQKDGGAAASEGSLQTGRGGTQPA